MIDVSEAISRLTNQADPRHRVAVDAAAQGLLIPLGFFGICRRASLRVAGKPAVHEILVDGVVVWRGAQGPRGWESEWLVPPDALG